jgi:hypothetical protein
MSFTDEVRVFALKVDAKSKDVITEAGVEVQRSLVEGSEITGAPGQPVDTGFLRSSFIPERISEFEWQTTTNVSYAPVIEYGIREAFDPRGEGRPYHLRGSGKSLVGGSHSVALTRASWARIADVATARVAADG